MNREDTATNGIHLMLENKVVMRIERDHIWVDPDVAVDETAQQVIKVLESYIVNMIQREVATEREACALAAEAVVPRHTECGNKIAAAIRARGHE
jgi:hypothetical protein